MGVRAHQHQRAIHWLPQEIISQGPMQMLQRYPHVLCEKPWLNFIMVLSSLLLTDPYNLSLFLSLSLCVFCTAIVGFCVDLLFVSVLGEAL